MPVAAGECEFTRYGFRELLSRGAIDIVQPDVSKAGGISECKKIANLASAFNIPYAPHVWGSAVSHMATLHLAASIPNFLICEVDRLPNPLREELILKPMQIQNGYIKVPQEPGLGVSGQRFRAAAALSGGVAVRSQAIFSRNWRRVRHHAGRKAGGRLKA